MEYLLRLQDPEGFWVGELEADRSLESDAILFDYYLGNPKPERVRKLANCIREEQTAEGGWRALSGRPSQRQSHHQSLFCSAARRRSRNPIRP